MVFEEKTPDLLVLLTTHTGGASPAIPMVPQPPTPTPMRISSNDATEKKRKRGQGDKSPEGTEEGEIIHSSQ